MRTLCAVHAVYAARSWLVAFRDVRAVRAVAGRFVYWPDDARAMFQACTATEPTWPGTARYLLQFCKHGDACVYVCVCTQILHNLVGNSCKFTKAGHVLIGVRYDSRLRAVALSVSDTGCGIPSEALHSVFDAFSQGLHRASEGLGLGLHLVVEFVKAHHGLIEARFLCHFIFHRSLFPPLISMHGLNACGCHMAG